MHGAHFYATANAFTRGFLSNFPQMQIWTDEKRVVTHAINHIMFPLSRPLSHKPTPTIPLAH